MKTLLFLAVVIILGANPALGQGGAIGIFADPSGASCNLDDVAGVTEWYVVHINHDGATGIHFSAKKPDCFTGVWLADVTVFPVTIKDSQNGIAIGYGSCLTAPTHVLTINYYSYGDTPPCCEYLITADPAAPSGLIEGASCEFTLTYPIGLVSVINSDGCSCLSMVTVPTDETTWGKVKALYAEGIN